MDYQLSNFQFCRLYLASFKDRFTKHSDDVIMTSFHVVGILKSQSYKSIGCLDRILWRLV